MKRDGHPGLHDKNAQNEVIVVCNGLVFEDLFKRWPADPRHRVRMPAAEDSMAFALLPDLGATGTSTKLEPHCRPAIYNPTR